MRDYTLTHLSDAKLLRELTALVSRDRETTALLLAHIAEVDARRAHAGAGYPSLFAYCVEELHFSEDASYKRIQAARTARLFPALFQAVADGRLHLTAICLLAPHLNPQNVDELVRAATHRKKTEIEGWLAVRFPGCGSLGNVSSIKPLATGGKGDLELALEQVAEVQVEPERYLVRVTIARNTHDKLRYAQALLSHTVPSGDVAQVLDRALDALIARLERRKLGAARPAKDSVQGTTASSARLAGRGTTRYIPARVRRRAVWERDGARCTFVGAGGHRCQSRRFLEFDHTEPFARGGAATVNGLRLRCHAHNQYAAERVFGAEFMRVKRNGARVARRNAAAQRLTMVEREAADEQAKDLEAGLRGLGCRADEARRAAEYAMAIEGAAFEDRLRAALTFRSRRTATRSAFTEACEVRERRARYGPRAWERYRGQRSAAAVLSALQCQHANYGSRSDPAWGRPHGPGWRHAPPGGLRGRIHGKSGGATRRRLVLRASV